MYSRRFSDGETPLPPDYGGVALRREKQEDDTPESTASRLKNPAPEDSFERRRTGREERNVLCPNIGRVPRRPLYESECGGGKERKVQRREKKEEGILHSDLFSFGKRSFKTEDILLAGLILLLLGDRNGGKEPDGQLLLILGLLLFT